MISFPVIIVDSEWCKKRKDYINKEDYIDKGFKGN